MKPRIALHAEDAARRLALVRAFESSPPTWDVFLWSPDRAFDVRVTDAPQNDSDVAFDEREPARAVADVAASLRSTSRRVAVVTGARRGCGTSTIALHLAAALVPSGEVCLVDLDPQSSLRARLGLPAEARRWGDGEVPAGAAVPIAAGFRVMLAPRGGRGDGIGALRYAADRFDHVIVDAPESPWRAAALRSSSHAILVLAPNAQSIEGGRATLELYPTLQWLCVVNRLGAGGETRARDVARLLEHPVITEFPCSPFLRDREDQQRLLTAPWSRFYRRSARLAERLR